MKDECREFCKKLSDYLDGQLDENICTLLEKHLEECPPCGLMYESLKTAVELCRKGINDDIPEEMSRELKAFLRTHCKGS